MLLTKEMLKDYSEAIKKIKDLDRRIEYYSKKIVKSEHGVVKGSMTDYPYAERHIVLSGSDVKDDQARIDAISQLLVELSEKRAEYARLNLDIALSLEMIFDDEMRNILFLKYVENKSDVEIAKELGFERSTITHKINSFFKNQRKYTFPDII